MIIKKIKKEIFDKIKKNPDNWIFKNYPNFIPFPEKRLKKVQREKNTVTFWDKGLQLLLYFDESITFHF